MMVPNCGVFTKRPGVPRLTWFKALKNSARNWNLVPSRSLHSRASAKSSVARPGPMTVLRPRSPKVKAGGVEKAFESNHSAAVCVPDPKGLAGKIRADRVFGEHCARVCRVYPDARHR